MSKLRIACVASAALAFWLIDLAPSQAQYRNAAPLNRGIGGIQGFARTRTAAPNRNIRNGRNGRFGGGGALIYGNTGHEFARTIPRVFGDSVLPYFSLYPPVYYSMPVPRPYGFSPFALPPGVQPAEGIVGPAEPEVTINPYFKPKAGAEQENDTTEQSVATPQYITNPYHVKRITPAESKRLAVTEPADLR